MSFSNIKNVRNLSLLPEIKRLVNYQAKNLDTKPKMVAILDKRTSEHQKLQKEIKNYINNPPTILSLINGVQNIPESTYQAQISPFYHHPVVANFSYTPKEPLYNGLKNFQKGKDHWNQVPIEDRMEIMLKIADLVKGKYYYKMMAATIVGQGKSIGEADIDCIQELVDFLNFNVQFSLEILKKQPISTDNISNYSIYKPLNGYVASYTPFNFTAIAGNLATAPLIWGNSVFWKPSENSLLSNNLFYEICLEAGVPPEVLHFVIADYNTFTQQITSNKNLGAVLFTGSTFGFNNVIKEINDNYYNQHVELTSNKIREKSYNYPRLIGETGGKNFHFVDVEANIDLAVDKTFQSAFGYSGQKCSACSRLYLPESMWEEFKKKMIQKIKQMNTSEITVIRDYKYNELSSFLKELNDDPSIEIYQWHEPDNTENYFIPPTLVLCFDENHSILKRELFGPILSIRLYSEQNKFKMMEECKKTTPYSLTGAVFSDSEAFLNHSIEYFGESCGNFYINDKSTGAVVGQQPFGGFGISGTNDKAGDSNFMLRLCHQQNVKVNNYNSD